MRAPRTLLVGGRVAIAALVSLLSACQPERPGERARFQLDFIDRFPEAVASDAEDFLGLLLPRDGVVERKFSGRRVYAIAGRRAAFDCALDPAASTELILDARPSDLVRRDPPIRLDVFLNDELLASFPVTPQPRPIRLPFPPEAVRPGLNTLTLVRSEIAPADAGAATDGRPSVIFPKLAVRTAETSSEERRRRVPVWHPPVTATISSERRRLLMQREVRYRLTLPDAPRLRFGIGADRRTLSKLTRTVPFTIKMKHRGKEDIIFATTLRKATRGRPGWYDFEVPLEQVAGETVEIAFTTTPPLKSKSPYGWSNPVLVSAAEQRRVRRRNVLVIALDTVRADHLSSYGYPLRTTPNLDALAGEGTIFTAAISQAPWTLPSFSSFLTSRYPTQHGAGSVDGQREGQQNAVSFLDTSFETLPEYLKKHGYGTLGFVTNPYLGWVTGIPQGFDTYVFRQTDSPGATRYVREWLTRHRGEQFFIFLHLNDAHQPTNPPRKVFSRFYRGEPISDVRRYENWGYGRLTDPGNPDYQRFRRVKTALYDGAINYMDTQLGGVFKTLKDLGEYERTLIVVFADHGEEFWDHGALERKYYTDYRGIWGVGHGHSLFRELLHVPVIVKGIASQKLRRIDDPIDVIDLYPTILDELGLPIPTGIAGRSVRPLLEGQRLPPRPQIAENILYGPKRYSVIHDGWHYIHAPLETDLYFDLSNDEQERNPILDPPTRVRDELRAILRRSFADHHDEGGQPHPVPPEQLDEETRQKLKALGYL